MRQSLQECVNLAKHGWVHCDLKADNILISAEGQLKFTDFNVSLPLEAVADLNERSDGIQTPEHFGVAGAMPQASLDLWCLGMTFLELLSGDYAEAIPVNQMGSRQTAEKNVPVYERWRRNYLGQLAAGESPLSYHELADHKFRALQRVVAKASEIDAELCRFTFERLLHPHANKRGTAAQAIADFRQLASDRETLSADALAAVARIMGKKSDGPLSLAFSQVEQDRRANLAAQREQMKQPRLGGGEI